MNCKFKCFSLIKLFVLTTILHTCVFAVSINLEWLKAQPKSYARDFYISEFLQQEITPTQANEALILIHNMNMKLFFLYAKKLQHDETYATVQCMKASNTELLQNSADCLVLGLSTYDMTQLSYEQKNRAFEILHKKYPNESAVLSIINAPLPFTMLIAASKETFFDTFNQCGSAFREAHFNYKLPAVALEKIQDEKSFNTTIKLIVTNPQLSNLQASLLQSFSSTMINHSGLFYLGLNALIHDKKVLAEEYFVKALEKVYLRSDKDRLHFWLYQTTQDKSYLQTLNQSVDINIYSLYAKDAYKQAFKNIVYDFKLNKNSHNTFDVTNPFSWFEIKQALQKEKPIDIEKYEALFAHSRTKPHMAYVYEKASKYQQHYFITPFENYLKDKSAQRKALIYALSKQESHFIASAISPSYALGTMQIMPFLAQHIAKELKEPFNIYAQLNPKTNLKYANFHLDYLEKHLDEPLFIAYAYNGGIGFTKRALKTELFNLQKEYEPFLSMELIANEESKEYGKKVLTNYFIYYNHFNPKKPISFSNLIQTIKKSDRK